MDQENVQGLILAPYRYRLTRHLFFLVPAGADARGFLRRLLPMVAHGATDLTQKPAWLCNVGITYPGLLALGCAPELADALDPAFKEGPSPLTMGDVPGSPSAASNWWDAQDWGNDRIHLTVQLFARVSEDLEAATADVLAWADGLEDLLPRTTADHAGSRHLDGAALPRLDTDVAQGAKVHFGYRDGLSQPEVDWNGDSPGKLDRGHFLLGYSSAGVMSSPADGPAADFFRDGSYMVLRWLQQDVATFEQFLTDAAPVLAPDRPLADGREFAAAKLLGRWRDGTPLTLSPDQPNPDLIGAPFGFLPDDAAGTRCPFSSHVRVAYPRDQKLFSSEPVSEPPRLIRRGMPYGPAWPDGQTHDDGIDRGLVGVFICASIQRQFYLLTQWISQTNFSPAFVPGHLHDQDSLFGNRKSQGARTRWQVPGFNGVLPTLPDFVRTRGTAFFLLPSLRTLAVMAD